MKLRNLRSNKKDIKKGTRSLFGHREFLFHTIYSTLNSAIYANKYNKNI